MSFKLELYIENHHWIYKFEKCCHTHDPLKVKTKNVSLTNFFWLSIGLFEGHFKGLKEKYFEHFTGKNIFEILRQPATFGFLASLLS
jgi:hypothetical protein